MNMITSLRIFREKKHDIWAIYLVEFFHLIGIIVYDYVYPEKDSQVKCNFEDEYDLNIFLDISQETIEKNSRYQSLWELERRLQKEQVLHVKLPLGELKEATTLDEWGVKILWDSIFCNIGLQNDNSLEELVKQYVGTRVFHYLYNRSNLQFIHEYYPIYEDKDESLIKTKRDRIRAIDTTFRGIADFYVKVVEKRIEMNNSFYYQYALLNCRFKLNQICDLKEEAHIFNSESLLSSLNFLRKEYDYIMCDYLAGRICASDNQRIGEAEFYFLRLEKELQLRYAEYSIGDFIYYRIGRYYEFKSKKNDYALKYYELAKKCNGNNYKALYKLAQKVTVGLKVNDIIELLNKIIGNLLNGYEMKSLTPKQQIYVYKSFNLLGKIYYEIGKYDLALIAFERAECISKTVCTMYDVLYHEDDINEIFIKVLKHCMPLQSLYLQIVKCAASCGETAKIEEYQQKLNSLSLS